MKKFYYLKSCSTCLRIIKELALPADVEMQNIKETPLTEKEVDMLARMTGGYEALINKRARKYQAMGLAQKALTEDEYKQYLLEDYTFLKRPVLVIGETIFVGNSKQTVSDAKAFIIKS